MTPDIRTLDEVIEHKQFFIHTIAKLYPDLDRDTIDIFISEILCPLNAFTSPLPSSSVSGFPGF